MTSYEIQVDQTSKGLYLTATISGKKYGQAYPHRNTRQALDDFRILIAKYLTKGDQAVMRGQ